jgi:hypothetical protein
VPALCHASAPVEHFQTMPQSMQRAALKCPVSRVSSSARNGLDGRNAAAVAENVVGPLSARELSVGVTSRSDGRAGSGLVIAPATGQSLSAEVYRERPHVQSRLAQHLQVILEAARSVFLVLAVLRSSAYQHYFIGAVVVCHGFVIGRFAGRAAKPRQASPERNTIGVAKVRLGFGSCTAWTVRVAIRA